MSRYDKVVWFEGMNLDPHHLQQWDRYVQATLNARVRSVAPFDWGLAELEIDGEALANGQFAVRRCKGVTADGLSFNCPEQAPLPKSRAFDKIFSTAENVLGVFLAVPVERQNHGNSQFEDETSRREARFIRRKLDFPDDNSGRDERPVEVARPNLQLRFGVPTEPLDEYSTLKIAEIKLGAKNAYELNPLFVPPCLSVAASERLLKIGDALLKKLINKSDSLMGRRREQTSGRIEFTSTEVTKFWLLHTANSFIPSLNHLLAVRCHPEALFAAMLNLAGQLTTFAASSEVRPSELPEYNHNQAADGFNQLYAHIDRLLEMAISDATEDIPLKKHSDVLWSGRITETRLLQTASFFLIVYTDLPEHKVMEEMPRRVKITSLEGIQALVAAALPGLAVAYTMQAPAGRAKKQGVLHFRLEKSGQFWEAIARTGTIAIFVPAELRVTQLELVAVQENV